MAAGSNEYGQLDVSGWRNIISVYAGPWYTVGLKSDGTVVLASVFFNELTDWRDIISIGAGGFHIVGLRSDGRLEGAGANFYDQLDIKDWSNIGFQLDK